MKTKMLLTAAFSAALAFLQGVEISCAAVRAGENSVKLRAGGYAVGIDAQGMVGDLECPRRGHARGRRRGGGAL